MSLKTHMFYHRKTDEIVGVEDYGDGHRTSNVATSAIVFVLQRIGGQSWKQPLCYYLVHNMIL